MCFMAMKKGIEAQRQGRGATTTASVFPVGPAPESAPVGGLLARQAAYTASNKRMRIKMRGG